MHRRLEYLFATAVVLVSACSGEQVAPDTAALPNSATQVQVNPFAVATLPAECETEARAQSAIDSLLPQLFGPGGGRRGKAQGYNNVITKARREGNTALAETNVDSLVNYTLATYYDGNLIGGQSTATQERVVKFIYLLYCANNISPVPDLSGIFSAENTVLIRNSTPTTVVSDLLDSAAVQVEQGEVPSSIFGTFVSVYKTTNPLPTSLDWYGIDGYKQGAWEFVSNPAVTFTGPVLTGVCIKYDPDIASNSDLRLAHGVEAGYAPVVLGNSVLTTAGGTIEIGAYADPGPLGLACDPLPPPVVAARSVVGRMLQQFASLIVPGNLFAGVAGGGTGSQVVKFSPFAAVDIKLALSSTGPASPQYIPLGSTETTAPVSVTVTTRNGHTPIAGIPVTFNPAAGFAPSSATTGADGAAASTWTLVAGSNTGSGTPAQEPLTFTPTAASFSVTALQLTALDITTASPLPGATVGVPYSQTLQATGGNGSYGWSVTTGTPPAGVGLTGAGVLSGTPGAAGTSTFTVEVVSGSLSTSKTFSLTVVAPTPTALALSFQPGPSNSQCYALNVVMTPTIAVKVTDQAGGPVAGVQVNLVAVTNNGAKVMPSQPSATSGANGLAVFNTLSINKTGGYRLIASTQAPWPVASAQSGKFTISPAC